MGELHIVGWERFQHYKDRWPPWIKTYTELLASDQYLNLSGNRRAILHGLWLAYAMSHGQLADDTASLSRRLNLKVTRNDLNALNHAGFIHLAASIPLAERYSDASPHALARGEDIKQTEDLRPEGSSVGESSSYVVNEASYDDADDERLQIHDENGYLPRERDSDLPLPENPFIASNGIFSPGILPEKEVR